jgi:hypothetical protein
MPAEARYKYYALGLPAAASVGGAASSNDAWAGLSVGQVDRHDSGRAGLRRQGIRALPPSMLLTR